MIKAILTILLMTTTTIGCHRNSKDCIEQWDMAQAKKRVPVIYEFADACCRSWECQAKIFKYNSELNKDE